MSAVKLEATAAASTGIGEVLSQLACPVCYGKLTLTNDAIRCTGCERRYPIVQGIPVLIAERALSSGPDDR